MLEYISQSLELKPGEKVVEIGPGLGFLTRFLSATGAQVIAVELDSECVSDLGKLALPNVSVSHGDFLRFDFGTIGDTIKIVGNVPYQITTPIISHIFGEIGQPKPWLSTVKRVVLTVQYEVAQRFVAKPDTSEYSQITLLINYFASARILRKVPPEAFCPRPEVTSAVVEFRPLPTAPVDCQNTRLLRQVIKAGFSQRRKMMKNNLSFLHSAPGDIHRAFARVGISLQARAETLSLEQFAKLSDALGEIGMRQQEKT